MKWRALACDYDGTLAHDGVVTASTAAAVERFRQSGRHLFMVTGRELPQLKQVCPILDRFEWIVAENGALLYRPADDATELLCEPASQALVESFLDTWSFGTIDPERVRHQAGWIELLRDGKATLRDLLDATERRQAELEVAAAREQRGRDFENRLGPGIKIEAEGPCHRSAVEQRVDGHAFRHWRSGGTPVRERPAPAARPRRPGRHP